MRVILLVLLLVPFTLGVRCYDKKHSGPGKIRISADGCAEGSIYLPQIRMTAEFVTLNWADNIEPPFGHGDCIALQKGVTIKVRKCCNAEGTVTCEEETDPIPAMGQCERIFTQTGEPYTGQYG